MRILTNTILLLLVTFCCGGCDRRVVTSETTTTSTSTVERPKTVTETKTKTYVVTDATPIPAIPVVPATPGPEVQVTFSGADLLDNTGTATFGPEAKGATPTPRTFTITNTGVAPLTVSKLVLPTGFTLVQGFGADIIDPNSSTTFQVALDTATTGKKTGTLSFQTNDVDEAMFDFTITGVVQGSELFVDDGDTNFTTVGSFTPFGEGYQGDSQYAPSGTGLVAAKWSFPGLLAGTYRVSTTWVPNTNRATNAPYSINGGEPIAVDQKNPPVGFSEEGVVWQDLGSPTAFAGGTFSVTLTDAANGFIIADGVRLERVQP